MFRNHSPQKQQGSALVMAIFIITVVFILATALINIVKDDDDQFTLEVMGTRALAAANSGADYGLSQLFPIGAGIGQCSTANNAVNLPNEVGFKHCQVSYTCSADDIGHGMTQYRIESLGVCEIGQCDRDDTTCFRVSRKVLVEARGMN